ncbi:MAG: hypothetical protein AB7I27_07870, partial [Bacteriovoracaceae bacterium]
RLKHLAMLVCQNPKTLNLTANSAIERDTFSSHLETRRFQKFYFVIKLSKSLAFYQFVFTFARLFLENL